MPAERILEVVAIVSDDIVDDLVVFDKVLTRVKLRVVSWWTKVRCLARSDMISDVGLGCGFKMDQLSRLKLSCADEFLVACMEAFFVS